MESKDWTNELKKKVESSNSLPGPIVSWDELEAGMDRIVRRRTAWRLVGGISAVAAVLALILFLPLNHDNRVNTAEPVAVVSAPQKQDTRVEVAVVERVMDRLAAADKVVAKDEMLVAPTGVKEANSDSEVAKTNILQEAQDLRTRVEGVKTEERRDMGEDAECDIAEWPDDDFWNTDDEAENKQKGRRHRLSIGLGSSAGAINPFKLGAMDYGGNKDMTPQDNIWTSDGVISNGGFLPDGSYTNGNQAIPHIKWDGPEGPVTVANEGIVPSLSLGLGVRYELSGQTFALAGLSVEQFHATFTETRYEADDFWLLGPYAGFGVNLYQNGDWSVYTALTGHAEWSIKYTDIPVIYSAGLLIGAQINLKRYLALYAEPQILYRFKSENSHSSVSFEEPLKLNINIGLRFNL